MRILNISKFIGLFLVITLLAGLPGSIQPTTRESPRRVHPALVELTSQYPQQKVAVIVQKLPGAANLESVVDQFGGRVTKDLHIINAFVAELTARAAVDLGDMAGVRWISPDGAMQKSGFTTFTVRDEFSQVSFSNNNGTTGWKTMCLELGRVLEMYSLQMVD
jgi:hypothetical protein